MKLDEFKAYIEAQRKVSLNEALTKITPTINYHEANTSELENN